ncbi:MAG: VOC family protein [Chthoniobacterales bacterium]
MSARRYFDHIDLRVKNRERAQKFYAHILPAIGFTSDESGERWGAFQVPEPNDKAREFFGFIEDPDHRPNESRIAFWAETRADVDRIAEVLRKAGAPNIEGPQIWTEYTPGYYAVFFEDPDGNKLEVCCRERAIVAE